MTDTVAPWLATMRAITGAREYAGGADNPRIMAWRDEIARRYPEMAAYCRGYVHDSIPWCGLTVAYCMAASGIRPPFDSKNEAESFLWARAWVDWGRPEKDPRPGCVMVFARSGGGHVTLLETIDDDHYVCRGGNQSDAVTVAAYPKSALIAAVWPPAAAVQPAPRAGGESYEALRDEYAALWRRMTIPPARQAAIEATARKLIAVKPRYQTAVERTGVPWYLIAVLHERESGADFATHLHNGDALTARTLNIPAGRPAQGEPPFTWEASAIDALELKGLHRISAWPIERIAYECERWNGWGYRRRGLPSAYLWSSSDIYRGGKYVADGVWAANAVDRQCGCMPLLARMAELDRSIVSVVA
jgi:uncharacterized protein (TIGR02594 family)